MDLKVIIVFTIMTIPFFLLTVLAVTDAARKDFGTTGKKVVWTLIAFIPFIGFIIYLIFGYRKGKKS